MIIAVLVSLAFITQIKWLGSLSVLSKEITFLCLKEIASNTGPQA